MDSKYNEVELLFIREILDQHGEFIIDELHDKIKKLKLRNSGELTDSLDYKVSKYGVDPVLQISFFGYGRAIEIQFHKLRKNRASFNTGSSAWGNEGKRRKHKNTRWYAKTVYGSINRLLSNLSTEFTENEIKRLKGIIEYQKMNLG